MNKQGKEMLGSLVSIAVIAVAVVLIASWMGWISGPFATVGTGATGTGGLQVNVTSNERVAASTTLTVGPVEDRFVPTAAMGNNYHDVIVDGIRKGRYVDADTLTVAPGNKIQIYYGINSTSYYARKSNEFTVPDTGALQSADPNYGDANRLCNASTSFTLTYFDLNDQVTNATREFAVTNGQTFNTYIKFSGVKNFCYSPDAPILMVLEYDKAKVDDVIVYDSNGKAMATSTVPAQNTIANATRQAKAFLLDFGDGKGLVDSDEKKFRVYWDMDDSVGGNPQPTNFTLYDGDWYRNTYTGEYTYGYEDNLDADVGASNVPATLMGAWLFD